MSLQLFSHHTQLTRLQALQASVLAFQDLRSRWLQLHTAQQASAADAYLPACGDLMAARLRGWPDPEAAPCHLHLRCRQQLQQRLLLSMSCLRATTP